MQRSAPTDSDQDVNTQSHASSSKRRRIVRSRNGCSACRKQRKKCDERRPICERCAVGKRSCIYPETDAHLRLPSSVGTRTPTQISDSRSDVSFSALAAYASSLSVPTSEPPTSVAPDNNVVACDDHDWVVDLHALFGPAFPPVIDDAQMSANPGGPHLTEVEDSVWSTFMDTSIWLNESTADSDRSLFQYYTQALPQGVVFRDGSARHFYSVLASRADAEHGEGLMHVILALAAQHKSNLARISGEADTSDQFAMASLRHRQEAFQFLRTTAVDREEKHIAVIPIVLILLILIMALKGETGVLPFLLKQTSASIIKAASLDTINMPTVAAMNFIYSAFYSLSSPHRTEPEHLCAELERVERDPLRSDEVLEGVVGLRKEALLGILRANILVSDYLALQRQSDGQKTDIAMIQLELQSKCSLLQAEIENDKVWDSRDASYPERTRLGHSCYRKAAQLMLLTEVLGYTAQHPKVRSLVSAFTELLHQCPPRLEVGLSWPYIIVASCVEYSARASYAAFIQRAQWKGSAMPMLAEKLVAQIWAAQDTNGVADWRTLVAEMGSPLIL